MHRFVGDYFRLSDDYRAPAAFHFSQRIGSAAYAKLQIRPSPPALNTYCAPLAGVYGDQRNKTLRETEALSGDFRLIRSATRTTPSLLVAEQKGRQDVENCAVRRRIQLTPATVATTHDWAQPDSVCENHEREKKR